jgi:hypothetical protein
MKEVRVIVISLCVTQLSVTVANTYYKLTKKKDLYGSEVWSFQPMIHWFLGFVSVVR